MNALINNNQQYYVLGEKEEEGDEATPGEVLAIAVLSLLLSSVIIISSWSAFSYLTGNISDGGPIGLIFNLMRTTGMV